MDGKKRMPGYKPWRVTSGVLPPLGFRDRAICCNNVFGSSTTETFPTILVQRRSEHARPKSKGIKIAVALLQNPLRSQNTHEGKLGGRIELEMWRMFMSRGTGIMSFTASCPGLYAHTFPPFSNASIQFSLLDGSKFGK